MLIGSERVALVSLGFMVSDVAQGIAHGYVPRYNYKCSQKNYCKGSSEMENPHPISVRIPGDVSAWLRARAEANCRTVSGEIIALLKAIQQADQKDRRALKRRV
jgi:hypothetical protein